MSTHLPQTESPLWKSPVALLAGVATAGLLGTPIIIDSQSPRVISLLYIDASQSNQQNKRSIKQLCKTQIERLKEGDIRIDGKFADKTIVLRNQTYQERDRLALQKECKNAVIPTDGLGKESGTPLASPLESLREEIQKQRTLGNRDRAVAIFAIQAAEPKQNQPPLNVADFKIQVQDFVKDGNVLVFIGPDADLQQQLKAALADVENTNVCSYSDNKSCIDWAFETARKKP